MRDQTKLHIFAWTCIAIQLVVLGLQVYDGSGSFVYPAISVSVMLIGIYGPKIWGKLHENTRK